MIVLNPHYKIKTATKEQIYLHLKQCNNDFIPPLDNKVNINEYAEKLFAQSVTFEAWEDESLAGLIAAYFNDKKNETGFITNVSVLNNHGGKGIASQLLRMCIKYAIQNNFKEVMLEVFKLNKPAINLYKKNGFTLFENKNDLLIMRHEIKKMNN